MIILELYSELKTNQDKITDELIRELRKDPNYLHALKETERKLAIWLMGDDQTLLIKRRGKYFV